MIALRTCSVVACLVAAASSASAAIVNLDIQVNTSTKAYQVFASIDDPTSKGLASFRLDVLGADGAAVATSSLQALRVFDPAIGDSGEFKGFSEFRSSGTIGSGNVLNVQASQDTVGPSNAERTMLGFGVGTPFLLSQGIYTGLAGSLTARVSPGFLFNLLPPTWTPGSNTVAATNVVSDTVSVVVPEPATWGLAAMAATALLVYRRKKRTA